MYSSLIMLVAIFLFILIFYTILTARRRKDWRYSRLLNDSQKKRKELFVGLRSKAKKAGLNITQEYILGLMAAGMIGGFIAGYVITGTVLFALIFSICGIFIYKFIVNRRISGRVAAFNEGLATALDRLIHSLDAGLGVVQAVSAISKDQNINEFTRNIFVKVMEHVSSGSTISQALEDVGEEIDSPYLNILSVAIAVNANEGSDLVKVLTNIQNMLYDKKRFEEMINAKSAQGRLTAIMATGIVVVVFFMLRISSPLFMDPLIHTLAGNIVMIIIGVFTFVGYTLVNRIFRIKF